VIRLNIIDWRGNQPTQAFGCFISLLRVLRFKIYLSI